MSNQPTIPSAPRVPRDLGTLRSSDPPDPYVKAIDEWGVTLSSQLESLRAELSATKRTAARASDANLEQDASIARLQAGVSAAREDLATLNAKVRSGAASPQAVTVLTTLVAMVLTALLRHFGLGV